MHTDCVGMVTGARHRGEGRDHHRGRHLGMAHAGEIGGAVSGASASRRRRSERLERERRRRGCAEPRCVVGDTAKARARRPVMYNATSHSPCPSSDVKCPEPAAICSSNLPRAVDLLQMSDCQVRPRTGSTGSCSRSSIRGLPRAIRWEALGRGNPSNGS